MSTSVLRWDGLADAPEMGRYEMVSSSLFGTCMRFPQSIKDTYVVHVNALKSVSDRNFPHAFDTVTVLVVAVSPLY